MYASNFAPIGCLLLATILCHSSTEGVQQYLTLYEDVAMGGFENRNSFSFYNNAPNITAYPLDKVDGLCIRGIWAFYAQPNYQNFIGYRQSSGDSQPLCYTDTTNLRPFGSLKYIGAKDPTSEPALYLFSEYEYQGEEYVLYASRLADGKIPLAQVRSWVFTGFYAQWNFFDDLNLQGNHATFSNEGQQTIHMEPKYNGTLESAFYGHC